MQAVQRAARSRLDARWKFSVWELPVGVRHRASPARRDRAVAQAGSPKSGASIQRDDRRVRVVRRRASTGHQRQCLIESLVRLLGLRRQTLDMALIGISLLSTCLHGAAAAVDSVGNGTEGLDETKDESHGFTSQFHLRDGWRSPWPPVLRSRCREKAFRAGHSDQTRHDAPCSCQVRAGRTTPSSRSMGGVCPGGYEQRRQGSFICRRARGPGNGPGSGPPLGLQTVRALGRGTIEVVEGDRVHIFVTNRLPENCTACWHGQRLPNGMDGVTGLTSPQSVRARPSSTSLARRPGTFMYHPHADEMTQMAMGMMGFWITHPGRPSADRRSAP